MALNMAVALNINAGVQGGQQVEKLTRDLRAMGQQGEISAKQMGQAMRMLPAQFQDVAVSLAGGQNPLMVLLQQGSQITTQFGGLGNALRGIGSMITPAVAGFSVLAGAIGSVAAAYIAGYKESREFSRSIALTGNFAGVTADSYEKMAAAIAAANDASMSTARGFLSAAVGTGDIGPSAVAAVGQAMTNISKLTGATRDDVVKMFDGLTDSASDWAEKTNRSFNFLSREQFAYIRQLEEQGRREDAIKYAVDAFNSSLSTREVAIGSLERAWNALGRTVSNVMDAFKSIGRTETIGDEMAGLQRRLDAARRMQQGMAERGQVAPGESPEMQALQMRINALSEMMGLEEQQASIRAQVAAANKQGIADEKKAEEERKKAAQEELARAKARAEMMDHAGDEIFRLVHGETAYQLLLGIRKGMTDGELIQLRQLLNARQMLKVSEEMGEEEAKRSAEARKRRDDEALRIIKDRMKLEDEARRVIEANRTPLQKYNDELDRLQSLLQKNVLSYDDYLRAVQRTSDEFRDSAKEQKNLLKELADAVEGWGKQSASAMADFVMGTKSSFRDLAQSIIKDMIQMIAYRTITQPLFATLGKMFAPGPTDISEFRAIPGLADGGVMSSRGLMPLKRYARGGVATSPQLAMFGEGSMPEAYVPLPDGRSIPVTMQGGGETSVIVNVSMDGAPQVQSDRGAGELGRLIAGVVKAELINQRRPGGLLAA